MPTEVYLVSQDGDQFEVSLEVAKMSKLVEPMLNGIFSSFSLFHKLIIFLDDQNDEEIQEISLPNVKTQILVKVIEFIEHFKVEPMTEIQKV